MPFPKTIDELKAAGYRFDTPGECRGEDCRASIEFWITPKGNKIPLDVDGKGNVVAHFSTCPNRGQF